ncbi:MAG: hypothetical protein PHT58_03865 [Eubacteriales bacterium]|nr:hypothetical protein [Eubacteriales bacterium]
MFTVFCDNAPLYDPRLPEYVLIDPVLSLSKNEPARLSFGVPKTNPNCGAVTRLQSRVKVYRDDTLVFLGRVIEDGIGLNHRQTYVAEGALAFLLDSVQRPFSFDGTVAEFFTQQLNTHNAQVNAEQQIGVGSVTVESGVTMTAASDEYASVWSVLKALLVDVYGGYLVLTFDSDEHPILSYLAEPPDTATQHIEFGENLIDLAVTRNADETYTACIPLGAPLSEIDEHVDSDERLTIADANGGLDYLVDAENAALYGVIFAPVELTTFEDEKNATYLMQRGRAWLSGTGTRLKESITLTAVDLHNVNAEVETFSFLDRVIVSCGDICPASEFVLSGMEIPLNNPGSMSVTLGDTRPSLIGDVAVQNASAAKRLETIEADYVTNQEVMAITTDQIVNNTTILQSAQQIILSALEDFVRTSDYTAFQSSIQTTLSIMAGTIEANFTETTSDISEMNGAVSQQFESIRSFIRLIASGIVIGQSNSAIKLKLENDVLYFFTGAEDTVAPENAMAYFSAGKLYVNDVEILTSMRIGPFAWVPESDNLNFKLMEA